MDDQERTGAWTVTQDGRRFVLQRGRLTLAGIVALLIAVGSGWGLYLSWDWLAAAGLLTAVLILLGCGVMCTTRWWSRWFGGGRSDAGSQDGPP